jgi:hypothetical protein
MKLARVNVLKCEGPRGQRGLEEDSQLQSTKCTPYYQGICLPLQVVVQRTEKTRIVAGCFERPRAPQSCCPDFRPQTNRLEA